MDDLSRRHFTALKNAFDFARADELAWRNGAQTSFNGQVAFVRECISRRVPCGSEPGELISFFLGAPWDGRVDLGALWAEYARSGYIDTKRLVQLHCKRGPLRAFGRQGFVSLSPLEMAVALEHQQGYEALLDCGASLTLSRDWKPSKTPPKEGTKAKELGIFGFMKLVIRSEARLARFKTLAARAMGASPLELAAFEGDLKQFVGLLAAGADIQKIPSRQWDVSAKKPMDMLGFIKFAVRGETARSEFTAVASQSFMEARIRNYVPPPPASAGEQKKPKAKKTANSATGANTSTAPDSAQLSLTLESTVSSPSAGMPATEPPSRVDGVLPPPSPPTTPPTTPRMRRMDI